VGAGPADGGKPGDRFQVVAAILRGFAPGAFHPGEPAPWLEILAREGVHPASLALCCQGGDFRWVEPLRGVLARLEPGCRLVPEVSLDTIVAWSPLTYAHEIEYWHLGTPAAALPDSLLALRGLRVQEAPRLRALGRGWAVVGRLQVLGLPRLEVLQGPLEVYGDLELAGLPELRDLGPGIAVHGNLTLAGCPGLAALPGDLRVDGAIWADVRGAAMDPGRVASPWPGLRPAPVAIAGFPAGVLELAAR
jgi:hypothetical protein